MPEGKPHKIEDHWTADRKQDALGEHEVMNAAAKEGFAVRWLEEKPARKKAPGDQKNPDCEIEGKIFDIYSPREATVDQIIGGVGKKVGRDQTERVVINMRNRSVSEGKLVEKLEKTTIPGLKEVVLFNEGKFSYPSLPK